PNVGPEFSGVAMGEDGEPYCVDKSMNMTSADVKKTLMGLMPLIQERLKFLTEAAEMVHFMFTEPAVPPVEQLVPKKLDQAKTKEVLENAKEFVAKVFELDHEGAENFAKAKAEELGIKLGDFMMPVRMAVTGSRVSPPLIGSIAVLGKEKSLARIERTIATL
ncbi:MAG: glutamate--tRNA ligase, partial [Treponema sp.]|nr:glutamate--tRNA ligase [Treponema sp.]